MDLGQAQRLVHFLGAYGGGAQGRFPQKTPAGEKMQASWLHSSIAAAVLSDFPQRFERLLYGICTERGDTSLRLPEQFGHFYSHLFVNLRSPEYEPLRAVFSVWLTKHWRSPLTSRNRRLSAGVTGLGSWLTEPKARALAGIPRATLRKAIANGRLEHESREGSDGRSSIIIRRSSLEAFASTLSPVIDLKAAAESLGITRSRARASFARLLPDSARPSLNAPVWAVPKRDVDRMIAQVELLPTVEAVKEFEVALGRVFRGTSMSSSRLAQLVVDWRDGTLRAHARLAGCKGLSSLVFAREHLKEWAETRCGDEPITIPEAATKLRIKQEVAYSLVRAGLLKADAIGVRRHPCVTPSEIERFGKLYISARSLAGLRRTSSRSVIRSLRVAGISPIGDFEGKKIRQAFYETSLIPSEWFVAKRE